MMKIFFNLEEMFGLSRYVKVILVSGLMGIKVIWFGCNLMNLISVFIVCFVFSNDIFGWGMFFILFILFILWKWDVEFLKLFVN